MPGGMLHSTILTKLPRGAAKGGVAPSRKRISANMRKAMTLRIEKGLTIGEACKLASISEAAWHKNLKQPHVVAVYEAIRARYVGAVEELRARHKARAIEVAAELMETAKSESVRMRAVEFFASEARPGVVVNVSQEAKSGVYAYPKPGQRIVTIEGEASEADPDPT